MATHARPIVAQKYLDEARAIGERFPGFIDGCRIITVVVRRKDGENARKTVRNLISDGREDWVFKLALLLRERDHSPEVSMRIYQSINARDVTKGINIFKEKQLTADHLGTVERFDFYLRIKAAMVSALSQARCATTKYFLLDCDTTDKAVLARLDEALKPITEVVLKYPSKNGWHIIVKPCNPAKLELPEGVSMQKDALMLLYHDQTKGVHS